MSDLLLIVEPIITYVHFSTECLKQIRLNRFVLNFSQNNDTNLWDFCVRDIVLV